jgi:hypothetical protein
MTRQLILVVSDRFAEFSAGKDALTLSQLKGILALPAGFVFPERRLALLPGQGLADRDLDQVPTWVAQSAHGDRFDLDHWSRAPRRDANALSHKRLDRNTLISTPRRLSDELFELAMLVDENCDLMGDHQTGQHLQGMLLVEAARQAFIAIAEAFFLQQGPDPNYFILDELNVTFKKFLFPMDVRLLCTARRLGNEPNSRRFGFEMSFQQAGHETAVATGILTAGKSRSVSRMETLQARDSLAHHVDALLARGAAGQDATIWAAQ